MAELFDLPADVAAGLSHMELLGDPTAPFGGARGPARLRHGAHRRERGGRGAARDRRGLTLKSMTEREVRIGGRIDGVEFLR